MVHTSWYGAVGALDGYIPRWNQRLVWSLLLSHTPHCFKGVRLMFKGDSCLVMNINNPFMHCVTSQYVLKPLDVKMLTNVGLQSDGSLGTTISETGMNRQHFLCKKNIVWKAHQPFCRGLNVLALIPSLFDFDLDEGLRIIMNLKKVVHIFLFIFHKIQLIQFTCY